MMSKIVVASLAASASAFQLPGSMPEFKPMAQLSKLPAAVGAAAITFHSEAAHAKSVIGVNGGLDFGPLAGDQPGGEGTGKALGINDDSLLFVLVSVVLVVFSQFAVWQS